MDAFQIKALREFYARTRGGDERALTRRMLDELGVKLQLHEPDLERIPKTGPAVIVCNHPYGMLEGLILTQMLTPLRPDVRIVTNQLLAEIAELNRICIWVDPIADRSQAARFNSRGLRECLAWLRRGGLLVMFPAGAVSTIDVKRRGIVDPAWIPSAAWLARKTGAITVPLHFSGSNSLNFHLLGLLHAKLRTAALPAEFLNKRGHPVEVRVGRPVLAATLDGFGDDRAAAEYLRSRTYLLAKRSSAVASGAAGGGDALQIPVAPGVEAEILAREVALLPAEQKLYESKEFAVWCASAPQIPAILCEIGRLREVTFRAVGEGSGRALDLDRFDGHYQQLFIWNRERQEIVGGYRLAHTADVALEDLYSRTLFSFDRRFLQRIGPAVELGRSFVRPEYQRQYAPLLLLWKGIGLYVARRPEAPVLFGAVSVSNDYSEISRRLIVRYFETRQRDADLARLVRARRPFRKLLVDWEIDSLVQLARDPEELGAPIMDLEPDGKGLPVLLRQYCRLGAKLLAFSVDPQFAKALDGMILVDLRESDRSLLDRYMGKETAASFLAGAAACRKFAQVS
ncbi:MAG: GNAT family N-acetyltransferase [Acidobacteria bacterium]|nr:GNAT family N-acetyltransferase [Acidobacteriota bacterium]